MHTKTRRSTNHTLQDYEIYFQILLQTFFISFFFFALIFFRFDKYHEHNFNVKVLIELNVD